MNLVRGTYIHLDIRLPLETDEILLFIIIRSMSI